MYHWEIKKLIVQILSTCYQLYPSNMKSEAEGHKFVCDQAKALLKNWLLLHGEMDENISNLLPHIPLLTC